MIETDELRNKANELLTQHSGERLGVLEERQVEDLVPCKH